MNQELLHLLNKLSEEHPNLECDGFSRAVHYNLASCGIEHTIMSGTVEGQLGHISLHYWIEIDDMVLDYRLRMWLGKEAPHGYFKKTDVQEIYNGVKTHFHVNQTVYEILLSL